MASSLYAALSGLRVNQGWLDLIGNNLANTNTPGYKTSQARFADQFSQTLQYAQAPTSGRGGKNPMQIGIGVRLAETARDFQQGALTTTGRTFDVAMQGNGLFAVSNGLLNLYTRVGTFGLDASQFLVDQRTGFQVLDPNGSAIQLDTESLLPPNATTFANISGNLPKVVTGPLAEVATSAEAFAHGTAASATSTNTGTFAIPVGETWTLRVTASGGAPQTAAVTSVTGTVTAAEVASAIDALDDVSASVDVSGAIVVTTDRVGDDATLKISSGASGLDLASAIGISTSLISGTESPATASTTLNDLPGNLSQYTDGDQILISGIDADGTAVNSVFTYGAGNDGTTVDDFVAFVDGLYASSTVSLDSSGTMVIEADTPGESDIRLSIEDDASSTGETNWSVYAFSVTTEGTPPDTQSTALEVFDSSGVAHTLTLTFERQADSTWTVTPSLPPTEGTVISPPITGLTFADDGSPIGLSSLDTNVVLSLTGQSSPQTVDLDLGSDGVFSGLTQFGDEGQVLVSDQDGYGAGALASMSVDADGSIVGLYSNGQTQVLGAMGIATFVNPEGLHQVGANMYAETTNSGTVVLGPGGVGRAGRVVGGALENSNVDTAEEFVALIQAQRGFQANARVITAQDEVLRDLVNLV